MRKKHGKDVNGKQPTNTGNLTLLRAALLSVIGGGGIDSIGLDDSDSPETAAGRTYPLEAPRWISWALGDLATAESIAVLASLARAELPPAVLASASSLVVFHNHPSGDPLPSATDRRYMPIRSETPKKTLLPISPGSSNATRPPESV